MCGKHWSACGGLGFEFLAMGRCVIELARRLDHHLFDTIYHAVASSIPGAVLVTADRPYFAKARHLGHIAWLADFRCA